MSRPVPNDVLPDGTPLVTPGSPQSPRDRFKYNLLARRIEGLGEVWLKARYKFPYAAMRLREGAVAAAGLLTRWLRSPDDRYLDRAERLCEAAERVFLARKASALANAEEEASP